MQAYVYKSLRKADTFVYHGPATAPDHRSEPFKERGEAVGAYCIAKTSDGDILTEIMPRDEIEKIRSKRACRPLAIAGSGLRR